MDILKVINTVRYMTPRQWRYRIYYTVRNKLKERKPKIAEAAIIPFRLSAYFSENIENKEAIEIADGICNGIIPTASGIQVHYIGDWDLKDEDYRLVSFKLNSFRWLLILSDAYKATGDKKYIDKGFEYINEWYGKCGNVIAGDKWNAYVVAERLTNWIGFVSEYGDEKQIKQIAGWVYSQAQELRNSFEFQLGANHLLSEAKGLVYAGAFLQDEDLYGFGKRVLLDEANEQFYPDGGHYEHSVSYHVESLQQYFESYAVMSIKLDPDAERVADIMTEPYRFLNGMIGVAGRIPLFNDSAYDYPFFDAACFLSTASRIYAAFPPKGREGRYSRRWAWMGNGEKSISWESKVKYDDTGFIHYQFDSIENSYSFFMDCGNNGPDYNLGHTHADTLSILLYSNDKEILVDSGVFTYKPGIERNECRSTAAHNTVEIDGKNSAEVWSAFRVAKRGHSKIDEFVETNGLKVTAQHDGYTKLLGVKANHIRTVEIVPKEGIIRVKDVIDGNKPHKAISRCHIGSKCSVEQVDRKSCLIDGHILIRSDTDIKVVSCKVAGMFGALEDSKCLEVGFSKETEIEMKL